MLNQVKKFHCITCVEIDCLYMNRFQVYEAFKQFGTIKQIKFGERLSTHYRVRIYYVGEAEPIEARAIEKLSAPEQELKVVNVSVIMRNQPWPKRLPVKAAQSSRRIRPRSAPMRRSAY